MSIAQKVAQTVSLREANSSREVFIDLCRYLMLGRLDGTPDAPARLAANDGRNKAASILETGGFRTRAAVTPGTMTDASWALPLAYASSASAWVSSLSNSAFDTLLNGGAKVVGLNNRVVVVTIGGVGNAPGESSLKVLSSMNLASDVVTPRKGTCIVVLTAETLRLSGAIGSALLDAELRAACAKTVDTEFLRVISDGATSTASAGATAAAVRTDISNALGRMKFDARSKIFAVVEPVTAAAWAMLSDTAGGTVFPMLGPQGGELAPGLRVVVSDGVSQGTWLLIDATGIAAASEGVTIDSSTVADLQFDDAGDSPMTASTQLKSLFQYNMAALKIERWFGASRMRDDAVQVISGIDFGNSPVA